MVATGPGEEAGGGAVQRRPLVTCPLDACEPNVGCCGQRVALRAAAVADGVVELVALVSNLVIVGVAYAETSEDWTALMTAPLVFPKAAFGASLTAFCLGCPAILLMFWGLYTERARLLLPHLVAQVAATVALLVVLLFLCIFTGLTRYELRQQADAVLLTNLLAIGVCLIALVLLSWFIVRALGCYRLVKLREDFRKNEIRNSVVRYEKVVRDTSLVADPAASVVDIPGVDARR